MGGMQGFSGANPESVEISITLFGTSGHDDLIVTVRIDVRNRRNHSHPDWQLFWKAWMRDSLAVKNLDIARQSGSMASLYNNNIRETVSVHISHNG